MIDKNSQSKHWASKNIQTIQSYFDSPPGIKRSKYFCDVLKKYSFGSLLEIGSFSGRNLKYISERFPLVSLCGVDINEKAVKFSKQKLPGIEFRHMDIHNIGGLNKKFDVVFTMGVLIHVPPENLYDVLNNLVRIANKYIIHIETFGKDTVCAGPKELNPSYKVSDQIQWNPDLASRYTSMGFVPDISALPKDVQTNGASDLLIIKI